MTAFANPAVVGRRLEQALRTPDKAAVRAPHRGAVCFFAFSGLANHGLTVPLQVADTSNSVRQGTSDPRQGNIPTCFDSDNEL